MADPLVYTEKAEVRFLLRPFLCLADLFIFLIFLGNLRIKELLSKFNKYKVGY